MIHLRVIPGEPRGRAVTSWDAESATSTCTIERDEAPRAPLLRDHIDALIGVREPDFRVQIGDGRLDISLDAQRRPTSIELRSNPSAWRRVSEPAAAPIACSDVFFDASFDPNGLLSIHEPLAIELDEPQAAFTVRFGPPQAKWLRPFDGLSFGIDAGERLVAIRFESVRR